MSAYLFQNLYNVLVIRSAHPKRRYVSWVKNDVNQFGLYLSRYLWIETGCLAQYARTSHPHEMSGTTIMALQPSDRISFHRLTLLSELEPRCKLSQSLDIC